MTFRLTDAEIKKVVHASVDLTLDEAYRQLCKAQVEKIARLLKSGATVTELEKEAK